MGLYDNLKRNFFGEEYDEDFDDDTDDELDDRNVLRQKADNKMREESEIPERRLFGLMKTVTKPQSMSVVILKPQFIDDMVDIRDALNDGSAVILNLEGLNIDIAQRIIDCTTGACLMIDGSLKSISRGVFVVAPRNIDVDGELDDLLLNNFGIK